MLKTTSALVLLSIALLCTSAQSDTFGSGSDSFDIQFVTIGNPGNAADDIRANPDFAGSVAQTYRIGKYQISEDMTNKTNTLGGLGITKDTRGINNPATSVSWFEAAYYDATAGVYCDYPTGSDTVPNGIDFAGDTTFDAVFFDSFFNSAPNDITDVGVFSPFGTVGQGGNVLEWEETELKPVNDSSSSNLGERGG